MALSIKKRAMDSAQEARFERLARAERERERELSRLMEQLFSLQQESNYLEFQTPQEQDQFLNSLKGIFERLLALKILEENPELKKQCEDIIAFQKISADNYRAIGLTTRKIFMYLDERKGIRILPKLPL